MSTLPAWYDRLFDPPEAPALTPGCRAERFEGDEPQGMRPNAHRWLPRPGKAAICVHCDVKFSPILGECAGRESK